MQHSLSEFSPASFYNLVTTLVAADWRELIYTPQWQFVACTNR